ncbi:helix-turn-helix domain-containing protein [Mycobacterium sp. 21AC1]|uniref:helix-turn-helix domain-containing protein n=1 Tax=[Mycobacterium] appelbergii TaxID=2939269 RepID=UPI0029392037|nr:helix-turn-helix domain-containing protein [Mycobacterium sp. 21AC1]MDV3129599.1 helix-turn-helix domain-containing protein [Mycobacterium sp. 21AC1]
MLRSTMCSEAPALTAQGSQKFSKLNWLKRTNGHKFKPAEFRVLIAIYSHTDGEGRNSFPGLDRIAEEACITKTTASAAVTALKARGWIEEVSRGSGRSKLNSVFELIRDAPDSKGSAYRELNSSAYAEPHSSAYDEPNQVLVSDHLTGHRELRVTEDPKHDGIQSLSLVAQLPMEERRHTEPAALGEAAEPTAAELEGAGLISSPSWASGQQVPWPRAKPLPVDPWILDPSGHPTVRYVDDETGEPFEFTPGELPTLAEHLLMESNN